MRKGVIILFLVLLFVPAPGAYGAKAPGAEKDITLAFAGDILLDGFVGEQIAAYGVKFPFVKVAPALQQADLAFANLETPVSTRGKPAAKSFVFRSHPATLAGLSFAGIDGVTLANNHILDYGPDAMLDTLSYLDQYKLGHTGAGKNAAEAFMPYTKQIKGKRIAILGASRVLSGPSWHAGASRPGAASAYEPEPLLQAIRKSAQTDDYTIVYMHWNEEFKDYPLKESRTLARQMIDSGADIILGAHSHTLMGIEYYKHKPIYYSLGNFVFNRSTRGGEKTVHSMLLRFTISGEELSARITPVKIIGGQPNLMGAAYNKETIGLLNRLSYNARIGADGAVTEKQ